MLALSPAALRIASLSQPAGCPPAHLSACLAPQDFEILMSGCVVIKPRADIFKMHPPIFEVCWAAGGGYGGQGT